MGEEIFYLLAYDKSNGKWRSADETLGVMVNAIEGGGPVRTVQSDDSVVWRDLEDGLEKDIDFENTESLGNFLKIMNNGEASF